MQRRETAACRLDAFGRGADIVSQGSAPASSSRTARSPSLADSLRASAAGRSLTSPPSVADAASEDEAAALSRKALGAGCDDEPEGMAQTAAVLAYVPQPPAAGGRLGDFATDPDVERYLARGDSGMRFEVLEEDDFWSGLWSGCDLVIAFKKLMKEEFDFKGWHHGYSALVCLSRERELLAACWFIIDDEEKCLYCPALATRELFRSRGIGRLMVKELERHSADSRPHCEQRVLVAAAPGAVGLWQRWGYRECLNLRERELARAIERKHHLFAASSTVPMLPRHRLHTSLAFEEYRSHHGDLTTLENEWGSTDSADAAGAASTATQRRGGSTGSTARKRRAARLRRMGQAE